MIINFKSYSQSADVESKAISEKLRLKAGLCLVAGAKDSALSLLLAKNKETLLRVMAVCKAFNFCEPLAISAWYLLRIKIQLGTPITIIKGGIKPERADSLKPNKTMLPSVNITPHTITTSEYKTG